MIPTGSILQGDCLSILPSFPEGCVDLIFADPPYNLQLNQELYRPNNSLVNAVQDQWDQFTSFQEYDSFTRNWLSACRRVLKAEGTIWVIGTYHNIHRVGSILQDLGFWILNEITWIKSNPMPNFRGVRFTNAHETLLWAAREKSSRHTFHHHAMKSLNGDLQMRSDWVLPLCSGAERLRDNGVKVHSTQKPEALLYRVILASTNPGDVILDPFFGSGTTGAVAKKLGRAWIGIERELKYIQAAKKRIDSIPDVLETDTLEVSPDPRSQPRIPFGQLLEAGILAAGDFLLFDKNPKLKARLFADGSLAWKHKRGSLHQVAEWINGGSCNGWERWYAIDKRNNQLVSINAFRAELRAMQSASAHGASS